MANKMVLFILICTSSLYAIRPSSYPFIAGDTFRSFCQHHMDEDSVVNPKHVQYADTIFLRTNEYQRVIHFFTTIFPHIKHPFILVSHDGDWSIPGFTCYLDGPRGFNLDPYLNDTKIIAWFAQNVDKKHPKLHPIPIGFANSCWSHGNVDHFKNTLLRIPKLEDKNDLLYLNFSLGTNLLRKPLMQYYQPKPFCFSSKAKPHQQYLEEMKQYRYVLCPPGNGQDCHRIWEALLVGSIVLIEHSALDTMFDNLPVIFIDNWYSIDHDFLHKEYKKLQYKTFNRKKLYASYWLDQISTIRLHARAQ